MVSHPRMPRKETSEKKHRRKRVSALSFYGYLNRYRAIFLPSLIALFVTAGLSLAFPYYLSKLIGSPTGSFAEALKSTGAIDIKSVTANINRTVLTLSLIHI